MIDWLWWAVDQIASEYGGGPRAVLDGLYLDELIPLISKINSRRATGYKMAASIAAFPHMDKKGKTEFMKNLDAISPETQKEHSKLDSVGMEALKVAMSSNPRIKVK